MTGTFQSDTGGTFIPLLSHRHVQALYEELLADVQGVHLHKQPVYAGAPVYTNGVEEELFKVGFCLPTGPYVTDEDVRYIVDCIKEAIV